MTTTLTLTDSQVAAVVAALQKQAQKNQTLLDAHVVGVTKAKVTTELTNTVAALVAVQAAQVAAVADAAVAVAA